MQRNTYSPRNRVPEMSKYKEMHMSDCEVICRKRSRIKEVEHYRVIERGESYLHGGVLDRWSWKQNSRQIGGMFGK